MSARNELYEVINQLIEDGHPILPGSHTARKIGDLLDRIEDNRSHHDANRIKAAAQRFKNDALLKQPRETYGLVIHAALVVEATALDPYRRADDGVLIRKFDGKPVTT